MTHLDLELLSCAQIATAGTDPQAIGLITTGAIEQHGPHLPVCTDTTLGRAVARGVANRLPVPVLTTGTISPGVSDVHLAFPGTIAVPEDVFEGLVLCHIQALARIGLRRVAIIDCNVPNVAVTKRAVLQAARELPGLQVIVYDDVDALMAALWSGADPGAGSGADHAGRLETSIMLNLVGPDAVRPYDGLQGFTDFAEEGWWGRMEREGIDSLSANGIIGIPAGASAEEGGRMVSAFVDECCSWLSREFALQA